MKFFKTTAAIMVSGLLIGSASLPAWSMTGEAPMQVLGESAQPPVNVRNWLEPSPGVREVKVTERCASGRLYSQHDMVGDPEACILQGITVGYGQGAPATSAP